MDDITDGQTAGRAFLHSVLALATCNVVVALLLLPYATTQSRSSGPMGVAGAAAICLLSGLAAEGLAPVLARLGMPMTSLLTGMAIRTAPPMVICLILAWQGAHGRQYLAFIFYLLAFYLVTLIAETWLAVKRVNRVTSDVYRSPR
jgi:hypothetical protein